MNDDMNDQDQVVGADIPTSSVKDNDAVVLVNLESLIKAHLANIDKLQRESREHKETLDNVLNNDPTYKQHSDAAADANKLKSQTRAEVMKRPDVKQVAEKLKSTKQELKDLQDELPEYLAEYQRLSNSNVIVGDNGEEMEIISVAKLVKLSGRK